MHATEPRTLCNVANVAARKATLKTVPSVQNLRTWTEWFRAGNHSYVPDFDPAEAGVKARVLILLESPGPMTNARNTKPGSGFVSVDNCDESAANSWHLRNEAGLHDGVLHWNIVPWYLGPAGTKPTAEDLAQGAGALRNLLKEHLNEVSVVVLCGLVAQEGWRKHVSPYIPDGPAAIETWHPSPLSLNQQGKREPLLAALKRAVLLK